MSVRRITGTVTVHELAVTLPFTFEEAILTLGVILDLPDQYYHLAAHIIARELERTVEWQDIVGVKHRVEPLQDLVDLGSMFDPRSVRVPVGMRCS